MRMELCIALPAMTRTRRRWRTCPWQILSAVLHLSAVNGEEPSDHAHPRYNDAYDSERSD